MDEVDEIILPNLSLPWGLLMLPMLPGLPTELCPRFGGWPGSSVTLDEDFAQAS